MASAPDLQASAEPCPAASRLQPGPAQGKLRRLSAPSLGAAMLKRLSLVVPLLAVPLLLNGCSGFQTPLDWFQSSLGWYRATPSNERTAADLDACKEQARAVNRREERLQADINGSSNFPDTAATSLRDPTLTRNMQAYTESQRYDRIVDNCMAARGYGAPGVGTGGGGAPAGGVKIAPPPSP